MKLRRRCGLASRTARERRTPGPHPREAIINPTREPWDEPVTARVILTFTLPDYRYLCRLVQPQEPPRYIYNCALREGRWDDQPITLTAPALGAPYAVMVLEKLMALGARMVLALGWCGSLQSQSCHRRPGAPHHHGEHRGHLPALSPERPAPGPGPGPVRNPAAACWRPRTTVGRRGRSGPPTAFTGKRCSWSKPTRPRESWGLTWKWRPCSPWAGSGRCRWPGCWWFRMNWPPCNGTRATARSLFAGPGIRPPAWFWPRRPDWDGGHV